MDTKIKVKRNDLFINTFDRMTVIRYCFRCPATGNLIFEDISTDIVDRSYVYHYCHHCEHRNECHDIDNAYSFDEETFNHFLKTGEVVKYNRLNAILYLEEVYRKKAEKWIKEYLT